MTASSELTESDRQLVVRCRKALKNLPSLVSLAQMLFWIKSAVVIFVSIWLVSLYLTKGGEAISAQAAERLLAGWFWVALWGIAVKTLKSEEQLARLVCKMA